MTGIVLCGFGVTRMGRAIRYVPYPVVGGFLGATGCLILLGAIRVITGIACNSTTLGQFANPMTLVRARRRPARWRWCLYLTWHRSRSPFGLPVILIVGVIAAHVAFWLAGISPAEAQAAGWTFQPPPHVSFMLPWGTANSAHYPWYTLPDLTGNLIAVVFVTASSTLFNTAGIEVAAHREANLERELNVTGIANILTGALGGYAGCISVSRSDPQFQRRRHRPAFRPDGRRDLAADAGGRPGAARLHAEIRARRPPDLSRRRPAAQMDRRVAAAAVARLNICRCWRSSSSSCNGVSSPAS